MPISESATTSSSNVKPNSTTRGTAGASGASSKNNPGAIASGVFGGIVTCAIVILMFTFLHRRHDRRSRVPQKTPNYPDSATFTLGKAVTLQFYESHHRETRCWSGRVRKSMNGSSSPETPRDVMVWADSMHWFACYSIPITTDTAVDSNERLGALYIKQKSVFLGSHLRIDSFHGRISKWDHPSMATETRRDLGMSLRQPSKYQKGWIVTYTAYLGTQINLPPW